MAYEWDDKKAAINRAKHGIGFESVASFEWETALVRADLRPADPEGRLVALGLIRGRLHVVAFVVRRGIRVISLRRASNLEVNRYEAEAD